MKDIKTLYQSQQWEDISTSFSFEEVAKELGLKKGMILAYNLLYNDKWDETLQEFGFTLLCNLKMRFPAEWNLDWKYEAFLGIAGDITLKYEKRYEAFMEAYKKCSSPPAELLIELARCCYCPGQPPISYEQSIEFLKESIKKHPYKQAASLLKGIYASKNDSENENYWSKMIDQMKEESPPSLEPTFLLNDR